MSYLTSACLILWAIVIPILLLRQTVRPWNEAGVHVPLFPTGTGGLANNIKH